MVCPCVVVETEHTNLGIVRNRLESKASRTKTTQSLAICEHETSIVKGLCTQGIRPIIDTDTYFALLTHHHQPSSSRPLLDERQKALPYRPPYPSPPYAA